MSVNETSVNFDTLYALITEPIAVALENALAMGADPTALECDLAYAWKRAKRRWAERKQQIEEGH